MAQIPSILNPVCILQPYSSIVSLAVSDILGGVDADDYISKVTFKLQKNNENPVEFSYTMNTEVSAVKSHDFNVAINSLDSFHWEIHAESVSYSLASASGDILLLASVNADSRIYISHPGAFLGVIFSNPAEGISTEVIRTSSDIIQTQDYSETSAIEVESRY